MTGVARDRGGGPNTGLPGRPPVFCRFHPSPPDVSLRAVNAFAFLPRFGCKILTSLVLMMVLPVALGGCGGKKANELVVGMELSYQPFEMLDERGQPAGIGVDLARELAASLHKDLRIENISFDGLITALKTGRIDLIVSSMTVNEERKQSIDFSNPYVSNGLAILVNAKSDIQGIGDVDRAGRTVIAKNATTGYDYAQKHFKQATVRTLGEEANCALEVSQGKADAFLYDQIAIYRLNHKFPDTTRALLEPFQQESWAIGIQKGRDELRQGVNAFLAEFQARGGMDKLLQKYIGADPATLQQMGVSAGK